MRTSFPAALAICGSVLALDVSAVSAQVPDEFDAEEKSRTPSG